MARQRKKKDSGPVTPGWVMTFTGLMILIMAFFVYLVTNASLMDERRIRLAVGSLMGTFGIGTAKPDVLGEEEIKEAHQPGPLPEEQDLAPLKELLWDDLEEDLQFVRNRFVQIFSVNTAVLFPPGESDLSEQGQALLREVASTLRNVSFPVLIAGHASVLRDELGEGFRVDAQQQIPDPSWNLSLFRALRVYGYLVEQDVPAERLRMEAVGRFHPRENPQTPEGRRANRRVEFILDKRARDWTPRLERPETDMAEEGFIYRDFIFRFPETGEPSLPRQE
ncbi:MAG TPA: flagellar motor protein MotB [Desulfonatronum sp.]|nr:flagellar motor protein MotB [Desulfonatronum sp.]